MQVRPNLEFRPVQPTDPDLQRWLCVLKARTPHFAHAHHLEPGTWLGLYAADRLMSAAGYTFNVDGSVLIEYVVCRPSKAGYAALYALMQTLRILFRGKRVVFFTQLDNRRMLKFYQSIGAKAVAVMLEVQESHG